MKGLSHRWVSANIACFIRVRPLPMLLTAKEFQLLEYFMKHPDQIVTRDQLMNQLWEIGAEPVSSVVAAQIRLLKHKLGEDNN